MSEYRWAGTHAYNDHANGRVIEPGEELPDDISERVAESHPYDVGAIDDEEEATDEEAGDTAAAEWSEEAWLEGDYEQRAEAVSGGRVDGHLEAIRNVETSDTVIEAVDERQAELDN